MKTVSWAALIVLACLIPDPCQAGVDDEIRHLLDFVARSDCRFIRNGVAHDPDEAQRHMEAKYAYFRNRVRTAEDFIDLAATRSSLSGRPYKVRCGEREMLTADWLTRELDRFRADP